MPKAVNNRIYLECILGDHSSYEKEMRKAIGMNMERAVIIWDQSKQEGNPKNSESYDLYVTMSKIDQAGNKLFDRSIWGSLLSNNLPRAKYIRLGCFKGDIDLIQEMQLVCKIIHTEEYGDQLEHFVEYNEAVKEYLQNRYRNDRGNIKWFNLALFRSFDENVPLFLSEHFGEENYIFELTAEEVEESIKAVEHNDVYIRINYHES